MSIAYCSFASSEPAPCTPFRSGSVCLHSPASTARTRHGLIVGLHPCRPGCAVECAPPQRYCSGRCARRGIFQMRVSRVRRGGALPKMLWRCRPNADCQQDKWQQNRGTARDNRKWILASWQWTFSDYSPRNPEITRISKGEDRPMPRNGHFWCRLALRHINIPTLSVTSRPLAFPVTRMAKASGCFDCPNRAASFVPTTPRSLCR